MSAEPELSVVTASAAASGSSPTATMRRQSRAVSLLLTGVPGDAVSSNAWRVAVRASWCRPRPSCTRIRSARIDVASRRAAQVSGSSAASTAWAPGRSPCDSERAARPRARWRADDWSPDAAWAVPASRSRASASGCPTRAATVAIMASRVLRLRASSRWLSASRKPARATDGCSSAAICARRPSRWGTVTALKGDSDNGVLPGGYPARRNTVLRSSLTTAAGASDQIDEPAGCGPAAAGAHLPSFALNGP